MTPLKEDVIIFDRKQQCGLVWFGLVMTSSSVSLVQGWLVDLINKFGSKRRDFMGESQKQDFSTSGLPVSL